MKGSLHIPRRAGLGLLALMLMVVPAAHAASASVASRAEPYAPTLRDRDDSPGRLDIARLAEGHDGIGLTHVVTMHDPWRNRMLSARTNNMILLRFDTVGDRNPERWVIVVRRQRALRAYVTNGRLTRIIGQAQASRPDRQSLLVTVGPKRIGATAGYRWSVFTYFQTTSGPCRNGCFDRAPDSGALRHDIRLPAVSWTLLKSISTSASPALSVPVEFSVTDTGYVQSGLGTWNLQSRTVGATEWHSVSAGVTPGAKHVALALSEGANLELRIVATDRHGNVTATAPRAMSVPLDDANAAFAGAWTGSWTPETGLADRFLGTRQTSTDATAAFTYSFDGSYVAWIGTGDPNGTATVTIDDGSPQTVDLAPFAGAARAVVFQTTLDPGRHTITIMPTGTQIEIDGIATR
jgi:hypothetical protein